MRSLTNQDVNSTFKIHHSTFYILHSSTATSPSLPFANIRVHSEKGSGMAISLPGALFHPESVVENNKLTFTLGSVECKE